MPDKVTPLAFDVWLQHLPGGGATGVPLKVTASIWLARSPPFVIGHGL